MSHIDKLAWIEIRDRKVLFVRSHGKDAFYTPGGKRDEGETDLEALTREVEEELSVRLVPDTIRYLHTFLAQAHGKPEGVLVQLTCYTGNGEGELQPSREIAEATWLWSGDKSCASATGQLVIDWLHKQHLID